MQHRVRRPGDVQHLALARCILHLAFRMARLLFADGPDLALSVVAAVRTDAMRRLRLVALGAEAGGRGRQRVVCAPLGGPGLGVSAFWIRHDSRSSVYGLQSTVVRLQSGASIVLFAPGPPETGDEEHHDSRFSARSPASRESSQAGVQSHRPAFRFVPHCAHRPLHPSRHSGFIGNAR